MLFLKLKPLILFSNLNQSVSDMIFAPARGLSIPTRLRGVVVQKKVGQSFDLEIQKIFDLDLRLALWYRIETPKLQSHFHVI